MAIPCTGEHAVKHRLPTGLRLTVTPEYLIETLGMRRHPEGGWFAETWRGAEEPRACGSAIYYMLKADEKSLWHRVDATEIWHWYGGGSLSLHCHEAGEETVRILGTGIDKGERPQLIVPANVWQMGIPCDGWVLVGCTVSPGFEYSGFELAENNRFARDADSP